MSQEIKWFESRSKKQENQLCDSSHSLCDLSHESICFETYLHNQIPKYANSNRFESNSVWFESSLYDSSHKYYVLNHDTMKTIHGHFVIRIWVMAVGESNHTSRSSSFEKCEVF